MSLWYYKIEKHTLGGYWLVIPSYSSNPTELLLHWRGRGEGVFRSGMQYHNKNALVLNILFFIWTIGYIFIFVNGQISKKLASHLATLVLVMISRCLGPEGFPPLAHGVLLVKVDKKRYIKWKWRGMEHLSRSRWTTMQAPLLSYSVHEGKYFCFSCKWTIS